MKSQKTTPSLRCRRRHVASTSNAISLRLESFERNERNDELKFEKNQDKYEAMIKDGECRKMTLIALKTLLFYTHTHTHTQKHIVRFKCAVRCRVLMTNDNAISLFPWRNIYFNYYSSFLITNWEVLPVRLSLEIS